MRETNGVLVLDAASPRMSELATRLRAMDYWAVCAKTAEDAIRLVDDPRCAITVALMPPELPDASIPDVLFTLRTRCRTGGLVFVVAGTRPASKVLERLRTANVALALWDPIHDLGLRFQINYALAGGSDAPSRRSLRVPTDWQTGFVAGGRRKGGAVYSLSATGVYLSTQRPSVAGARISLELPLPGGPVRVGGRVVYTNVPGNLVRPRLPNGMAIRFTEVAADDAEALRSFVEETSAQYTV